MKLNKKYQPNHIVYQRKQEKKDWRYPIFLPKSTLFSPEELWTLYYQELMGRNLLQFTGKNYQPLVIKNLHNLNFLEVLRGKEKLPLFAQYQRISQVGEKMQKKSQQYLKNLFFWAQDEEVIFNAEQIEEIESVFSLLSQKNLLQKKPQLIYRDVSNQTVVNTDDIERRTEPQVVLEIKCFVETKNEVLTIVVDDIMSLFSDVGVVVHANDKRYKKHIGKKIILPMINKSIPIFWEPTIDTLKDNWVYRINPLLSPSHLQKAQDYNLPIDESFVDESGHFLENVATFAGQSLFDFTENIIETLDTIGNLASRSEKLQQIPYSKITGQRLIKRVLPLWVIDYSSLQSELLDRIHQATPKLESLFLSKEEAILPLESRDHFGWGIFSNEATKNLCFSRPLVIGQRWSSAYEYLLLWLVMNHWLPLSFPLADLIDLLYLVPEEIKNFLLRNTEKIENLQVREILNHSIDHTPEQVMEDRIKNIQALPRIERNPDQEKITIKTEKLPYTYQATKGTFDQQFLRAVEVAIQAREKKENLVLFAPSAINFTKTLLLLTYLMQIEKAPLFISEIPALRYQFPIPEKAENFAKKYGRDALRLCIAQQKKLEESGLQENFDYLNHFRNLFKLLYEKGAFDEKDDNNQLEAIELRVYSQREELLDEYQLYQTSGKGLDVLIQKIQAFSRGQFTWYLEFVKKRKNSDAYSVAAQIFIQILQVLMPYIPEFTLQIESILGQEFPRHLHRLAYQGKKDYRLHLLFDIIKGVIQQKLKLKLKKHQSIRLAVRANQDILRLVEDHKDVFHALLKVEWIDLVELNSRLPSEFASFTILEIEIWIKSSEEPKIEDDLLILEKLYRAKLQQSEYLRTTLMMLSTNPLIAQDKVAEKEKELQLLKDEIDTLDIKIKKIKMQRRA